MTGLGFKGTLNYSVVKCKDRQINRKLYIKIWESLKWNDIFIKIGKNFEIIGWVSSWENLS